MLKCTIEKVNQPTIIPCPYDRGIIQEGKCWIRDCAKVPKGYLRYENKKTAEELSKDCRGEEDFTRCRFYGEKKCFNIECPFHHNKPYLSEKCDLEEIIKTKPHLVQDSIKKVEEKNIIEFCQITEKAEKLKELVKEGEKMNSILDSQKCRKQDTECRYYCKHNRGCALLLSKGQALSKFLKAGEVDCEVYRRVVGKSVEIPTEIAETSAGLQEFDYSALDQETAEFLIEKANRVTGIRFRSVLAIGKELSETFAKFAKLPYGNKTELFNQWCESIGISPRSARNYISAFDYIAKNFHNIEEVENIQPSLLFAISKPSTPKELQQAVLQGDVTSHKRYIELETKLKEEQKIRKQLESNAKAALEGHKKEINRLNEMLDQTQDELVQAKTGADTKRIEQLEQDVEDLQQEIQSYQQEIGSLNQRLTEKPVEVPVTVKSVEVEVLPEELKERLLSGIEEYINGFIMMSKQERDIFVEAGKTDKEKYLELLDDVLLVARSIRNEIVAQPVADIRKRCCLCQYSNIDGVTEEQLDEDLTYCEYKKQIVKFEDSCGQFKSM